MFTPEGEGDLPYAIAEAKAKSGISQKMAQNNLLGKFGDKFEQLNKINNGSQEDVAKQWDALLNHYGKSKPGKTDGSKNKPESNEDDIFGFQ